MYHIHAWSVFERYARILTFYFSVGPTLIFERWAAV